MAPTIGRLALDNGFHGSIPGDWVAPPPQNIHYTQYSYSERDTHNEILSCNHSGSKPSESKSLQDYSHGVQHIELLPKIRKH